MGKETNFLSWLCLSRTQEQSFDELKKHFVHTGVINAFVYQAKLLERFQSESE